MKPIFNTRAVLALVAIAATGALWNTRFHPTEAQAAKPQFPLAPEFVGAPSQWLNTEGRALSLASRKGKVTLVEFFAFECSNCRANLPAYQKWATKWKSRGVEIVGVHTPELPAERDPKNVAKFARDNDLNFPILIDGNNANWNRWKQRYWPTVYVVDGQNRVRFQWQGELEYGGAKGTQKVEAQVEAILAETATPGKLMKTDEQWKRELSPMAYDVLRHAGTEAPYSGALWDNHAAGLYKCAGCGQELFSSDTKFESGTGWPSFYRALKPGVVEEKSDTSFGSVRTEVLCARCGGHLGHVFDDGPKPTGLRYCMNSAALVFEKK